VPNEVEAFRWREEPERDRNERDDLIEIAGTGGAQEGLQLRKRQFDRIEVRTVGWQKAEPCADGFDGRLYLRLLVHREVIEHHNVAWAERRDQHLLDIREEGGVIERAVEDGGGGEAIDAERRDDRVSLPVAARGVITQPQAARAAAIAAQQIGGDARLVEEHVPARIVQRQRVLPLATRRGDIRTALFVGVYRFF
jgi:hypothetical protein